jgi:hypothetical protein
MNDRDFPDFVDAADGKLFRVLVCDGSDKPLPLTYESGYPSGSASEKAARAVYCGMSFAGCDERGLYWYHRADAEQAVNIARKAVGR